MNENKFSVLMSVCQKDSPEQLELALKSIYDNQTVKPNEIVVVFDGPLTSQLYDVLMKFKQNKGDLVQYYPQEFNKGLGESLRIGAEKCSGEYILRMDSDDISDSRRFEIQKAFVEAHPEIDVVGANIEEFKLVVEEKNKRIRSCPITHEDIVQMGKWRNPMNHVTVCIKRNALEKCGGYQTLLLLEDYYLWLRMIVAGCRLANINESLVYVRVGNGFNTRRSAKEIISGWKILQSYMMKHGMITRFQAQMNMFCINVFVRMPVFVKKLLYNKILRN